MQMSHAEKFVYSRWGGKRSTENKLDSKDQQPINSNIVMFSFPSSILSSSQYSIVLKYEYSNPFSITEKKRTKTEKYSM